MLTPPPGSDSREYGILRTFANEKERDDFYASPMFKAWEEKVRTADGRRIAGHHRPLHGLEAWFRSPHNPPPRWKMAVATFSGRVSAGDDFESDSRPGDSDLAFRPRATPFSMPVSWRCSTWVVMPLVTRLAPWLAAASRHEKRKKFHELQRLTPDLILHNGRITTLDPTYPEATKLAVKDGRIVGVDDAEKYERGPNTKVIDLKGRRVIPGLNDSHLHVIRGGLNYNMELRWDGVPSLADATADAQGAGATHAARPMGARGRRLERISIRRTPDADAGGNQCRRAGYAGVHPASVLPRAC